MQYLRFQYAVSIIIKYLAMKLTDKLKHYLCLVLAIVTCLMVALIAILSWGIVLFAIYDINTSHTFHSIEVYKISAAFWALLALPSHVFCQIIMYDDKIYAYVMSWIKNHSTKWQVVLFARLYQYLYAGFVLYKEQVYS